MQIAMLKLVHKLIPQLNRMHDEVTVHAMPKVVELHWDVEELKWDEEELQQEVEELQWGVELTVDMLDHHETYVLLMQVVPIFGAVITNSCGRLWYL